MDEAIKNQDKIKECLEKYLQTLPVSSAKDLWTKMHFVNLAEIMGLLAMQSIQIEYYQLMPLLNELMFGQEKIANFQILSDVYAGMRFVIIKTSELS